MSELGRDEVRQLDKQQSLPLIRANLTHAVETGEALPVLVAGSPDRLFGAYCNAVLSTATIDDSERACRYFLSSLRRRHPLACLTVTVVLPVQGGRD